MLRWRSEPLLQQAAMVAWLLQVAGTAGLEAIKDDMQLYVLWQGEREC